MSCGYPVHLLITTLLSKDLDTQRICKVQPLGVCKNTVFVIDIDEVAYGDIKADDYWARGNRQVQSERISDSTRRMCWCTQCKGLITRIE